MIWKGEPSAEISAKLAELGLQSMVFVPCGGAPAAGEFTLLMKRNVQVLKTVGPGAVE